MICYVSCILVYLFFFFKQKTAYEMRSSDWSSDVCSSDLKNTWFEYLVFDGAVAAIDGVDELDVGLDGRLFKTGSLLKLYSYRLPEGARSIISRDLNLTLNAFLFELAVPFLTVDNNGPYPENRADRQRIAEVQRVSVRVDPGGSPYSRKTIQRQ